jgi:hypothetical protein
MFDPNYPNLQRGLITVKADGTEITGKQFVMILLIIPSRWIVCFTESSEVAGYGILFTSIIQYGVLQKTVTVERHSSIGRSYTLLPML